jgi:hypothetical protein
MSSYDEPIEMDDVQGLILRGYNFRSIRYIVLSIQKGGEQHARDLCAALLPSSGYGLSITDASPWPGFKPEYCLNIGFTYDGMVALIGQPNCDTVGGSSFELFNTFSGGAVGNAPAIGDTDESDPSLWWKRSGGWLPETDPKADGSDLHIQLTLYTHTPALREEYYAKLLAMIPNQALVTPVFYKDSDPIAVGEDLDYIHFGYKDSLSQPRIGNLLWNNKKVRMLTGVSTIDDRPIVPPYRFAISTNCPDYNAHPLLKNGSFAAFRLLYQDVAAFNQFINSEPGTSPDLLAAKMCGRWFDGTPLEVSPNGEDKSLKDFDYTNFNYLNATLNQQGKPISDDLGARCPYAAHIRRTNPRDDIQVLGNMDLSTGKPLYAGMHRVVRRASPYGPPYNEHEKGEVQRGLVGLFIGANLGKQFQFIMQMWMAAGGFRNEDDSPNLSGTDPLFGPMIDGSDTNFEYCDGNTEISPPEYKTVPGLTRFIRTDGSLYLFLPGIAGLKWISEGKIPTAS